ncbi:DMT family transporter [Alteromonas sp. 14N.309.X.WAT.G.H12]|uniref:DMT family transporter n=1 Tax=Alteromonas sp. 14N.309.X.WAT.G.H12 TaxID=3120824 RepID=UPI002FD420AF
MSEQQYRFRCVFAIVVASILWGTTGTAASFAPDVSPLAIGAIAMGGGGLLMCLRVLKGLLQHRGALWMQGRALLLGAACVAIYPLAFYSSMAMAGVAIGTIVSIASAPCFAMILDMWLNRKPLTARWVLSLVCGVAGIACLTLTKSPEHSETVMKTREWGIGLGLLAGLTYAGYSWITKHLITGGVVSGVAMAAQFGLAACVLLPSLLFTGANVTDSITNMSVAIYMAVVPMFLGYLLFGYGLRKIDASTATLITLLEPVVATLLAVYLLTERFTLTGWIGIGLIGLCLSIQMGKKPFKRKTAAPDSAATKT